MGQGVTKPSKLILMTSQSHYSTFRRCCRRRTTLEQYAEHNGAPGSDLLHVCKDGSCF